MTEQWTGKLGRQQVEECGRRIALARKVRGHPSRAALARQLGVSNDTLDVCENGQRDFPLGHLLIRLACVLGVTTDWLLMGDIGGLSVEMARRLSEGVPEPTGQGRRRSEPQEDDRA